MDLRPPSFADEYMGDWELWVLAHGLPDIPDLVAGYEAVPIARWVGRRWAAVLHLMYAPPDDEDPAGLDTESQAFYRAAGRWEAMPGSGGTSWWPGLRTRPPAMQPDEVITIHTGRCTTTERASTLIDGVAGRLADAVEVEQGGDIERHPIDSPVGAWIVAFDGRTPARVRLLGKGVVLHEVHVDPE